MSEDIRRYWEHRAATTDSAQSTTSDIYLRELEVRTLTQAISRLNLTPPSRLLDVGCGDGRSTVRLARDLPTFEVVGIDYAENMVALARQTLESTPEVRDRVTFSLGDVLALSPAATSEEMFDVASTDRCLINLPSAELQARALANIAAQIRPGGYYIGIENFLEGQDNLTAARSHMGLPEIPVRWHNRFFTVAEFRAAALPHFDDIAFQHFSSAYYFATRVLYSAMCMAKGEEPDYQHEIHQTAVDLPTFGELSPIQMVVMRRRQV